MENLNFSVAAGDGKNPEREDLYKLVQRLTVLSDQLNKELAEIDRRISKLEGVQ